MTVKDFEHAEAARKIKQEYTHGRKEPGARGLDCIHGLIKDMMQGEPNLIQLLKDAAKAIYTQFNIKDSLNMPERAGRPIQVYDDVRDEGRGLGCA